MVRLITHNLLACHVKGCTSNNFPLEFKDVQIELREAEFNPDFLRGFMPKIEWKALVDAARQVRFIRYCALGMLADPCFQLGDTSLPQEQPEMLDDEFLKSLHHVLFEVRSRSLPSHSFCSCTGRSTSKKVLCFVLIVNISIQSRTAYRTWSIQLITVTERSYNINFPAVG